MTGKSKRYSADFMAKLAREALKGELLSSQLVAERDFYAKAFGR